MKINCDKMIITRTPYRISFFGGGTDYPIYYRKNGGSVLSSTIDKYNYIQTRYLPILFPYSYRLRYHVKEEVNGINDIRHQSVRECLKFLKINNGIEMVFTGDIPAQSGMGSSSAFTVGFLNSLYALKGEIVSKRKLALDAINIEQNILSENVGSQDQVAASFGGFNRIDFGEDLEFEVHPIPISKNKLENLQNHLLLFFTGISRNASEIAAEQIKKTPEKDKELNKMKEMVNEGVDILFGSDSNIDDFGKLLHESWNIKRNLSSVISTSEIDKLYNAALESGALGGKLLGAGGGGCLLFFVRPEYHDKVRERLKKLIEIPFRFENFGSQIIYYEN